MIKIGLVTEPDGLIFSISSVGHAKKTGEFSLACALVTELLQSFGLWLSEQETVIIKGSAPEKGVLFIDVDYGLGANDQHRGASKLLMHQLRTAKSHFESEIELDIEIIEGR